MANFIYNSARRLFSTAKIDWTGTSSSQWANYKIKAALVNKTGGNIQSYSPPADTSNDSVVYAAGTSGGGGARNMSTDFGYGLAAASSSLIRDGSNNIITAELLNRSFVSATSACDADDIVFNNVPTNATAYGAVEGIVIYLEDQAVSDATTWPVLLFLDNLSGGTMSITPNGGDIVVQWSTSGIFRL